MLFVLGGLFVAPNYIQWNEYKDVFEEYASEAVGRKVRVNGDVKLKILPAPYLEFSKVKINHSLDDPRVLLGQSGLNGQPFAEIETFKLWLAIPPLLQGKIKVTKLELVKPDIRLSLNENQNRASHAGSISRNQFIPAEISFDSISITDGSVSVLQTKQTPAFSMNTINGELSVASLKGPYKFEGVFSNAGELREITLATSQQDHLGNMRLKSIVNIPKTSSRYLINGELQALDNIPSFKGTVSGQAPIHLLALEHENQNISSVSNENGQAANIIDIRSNIYANLKRLELKDLSLSVADPKRPQNISGQVILSWEQGIDLETQIRANWLDLDKMLSRKNVNVTNEEEVSSKPVQMAFGLLRSVMQDAGEVLTNANIRAEIIDAKLGESSLSDFNFRLIKNGPKYRIDNLSVRLPGRNNISLSGNLVAKNERLSFSGDVRAKGSSLGALSHWALYEQKNKTFQNNPYFLKGRIKFTPEEFNISRLRGDLNGSRISGGFRYSFADKKEFVLELDSDEVLLTDVLDKDATLYSIFSLASNNSEDDTQKNSAFTNYTKELENTEGLINLRVGKVSIPNLNARDVHINGKLSKGDFRLASFKMVADGGIKINGKGTIRNINESAQGNLRLSIRSETASGLETLAKQLELSDDITNNKRLLKDLSPLNLAVTLNMDSGGLPSTEISVAGDVANSQLSLNARHEGILSTLGEKQIEVTGSLVNPVAQDLIGQLVRVNQIKMSDQTGQGVFSVQASGVPNDSIETRARLDAGTMQAHFYGDLRTKKGYSYGNGKLKLRSSDAAAGLSLIGLPDIKAYSGKKLNLTADLKKEKSTYHISSVKGKIGQVQLSGVGNFDWESKPRKVAINGQISEASLLSILSPLLPSVHSSKIERIIEATGAQHEKAWSNRPFKTERSDGISGTVKLRVGSLEIADKVNLNNAGLSIGIKNSNVNIDTLNGQLYNGRFSAKANLTSGKGPVKLNAKLSLKNADLAEIFKSKNGQALARGIGDISLAMSGEGFSPLGLVSELKGQGRVKIKEGEVFDFSPQALPKVISASNGKEKDEILQSNFLKQLKGDTYALRNISSPIGIRNGVLTIQNMNAQATPTVTSTSTYIELASMKIDSEWKLSALTKKRQKLPGVKMVFSGPLARLSDISPQIDVKELKQSLVVRGIEKNFDTLNKLNEKDPETIRRLRNSPQYLSKERGGAQSDDTYVSSIKKGPDQLKNLTPGNDNNPQFKDPNELPALTNLGKIDKQNNPNGNITDNRDLGVKYYYDQNGNPVEQQGTEGDISQPQERTYEEVQKKKKRVSVPSLWDRIFKEALGR